MFEVLDRPVFPRNIMTSDYSGFFPVHDTNEMFNAFERAQFKDCRISAYPPVRQDTQLIPNILLLDLDLDDKLVISNSRRAAASKLKNRVNRILAKLQRAYNIINFMVLWTGYGRHIVIPFGFERSFEHLTEFSGYLDIFHSPFSISEEFLLFAKIFLSGNQADPNNYPNFSSTFIRVPGTVNTKKKYGDRLEVVKIEHEWTIQGDDIPGYAELHPSSDLLYEFMGYLDDKALELKIKQDRLKQQQQTRLSSSHKLIPWIEALWNTSLPDCRKRIIWLVLSRYAINRRKMIHEEAFVWIREWVHRCNAVKPVNGITNEYINHQIESAKNSGYFPPSFGTLETYRWKINEGIDLSDLIKNRMKESCNK